MTEIRAIVQQNEALTNDRFFLLGTAAQANAQLNWFRAIREQREDRIVNEVVNRVRNDSVSFEYLYSRMSAISELRHLEADLAREFRQSLKEAEDG